MSTDPPSPPRRRALAGALALPAVALAAGGASAARTRQVRAWSFGNQQGLDSLTLGSRAVADPGAGEIRVRVLASALNHRDLNVATARYGGRQPATRVPLSDGAGEIVAVGEGVTGWKPGDRVTAPNFVDWLDGAYAPAIFGNDLGVTRDGWLAEEIVLPAAAAVRIPEGMSFEDAAAFPTAGITVWNLVNDFARTRPGEIVLALGTGGVSIMTLQIARMHGARVAITSSSDDKLARARELGAEILVNRRSVADWSAAVRQASGGRGVDVVAETVGLATLAQTLAACAPNARVGLIGSLEAPPSGPVPLSGLFFTNGVMKGITAGSRRMLEDLLRAAAAQRVRPAIDRRFAFGEARAAFDYLASGAHFGKVVVTHA